MALTYKICLGIGDIMSQVIFFVNTHPAPVPTVLIDDQLLVQYRNGSSQYTAFIEQLLQRLQVTYTRSPTMAEVLPFFNMAEMLAKHGHIRDWHCLWKRFNLDPVWISDPQHPLATRRQYVALHTKSRLETDTALQAQLQLLARHVSAYKAPAGVTLVLLGERRLSDILENRLLPIVNVYPLLLLLKQNNDVLDLTVEELGVVPSMPVFERDLQVIHNASNNILFGCGGNLVMCMAFAQKFSAFIAQTQIALLREWAEDGTQREDGRLYRDFSVFLSDVLPIAADVSSTK